MKNLKRTLIGSLLLVGACASSDYKETRGQIEGLNGLDTRAEYPLLYQEVEVKGAEGVCINPNYELCNNKEKW